MKRPTAAAGEGEGGGGRGGGGRTEEREGRVMRVERDKFQPSRSSNRAESSSSRAAVTKSATILSYRKKEVRSSSSSSSSTSSFQPSAAFREELAAYRPSPSFSTPSVAKLSSFVAATPFSATTTTTATTATSTSFAATKDNLASTDHSSASSSSSSSSRGRDGHLSPGAAQWLQRPFLQWDFLTEGLLSHRQSNSQPKERSTSPVVRLGALPPRVQELALLDDLLFAISGIEGQYVKAATNEENDIIFSPSTESVTDASQLDVLQRVLSVGTYYVYLERFVHRRAMYYEEGMCSHALAAALRTFLDDYLLFVAQLDNELQQERLTLQIAYCHLQTKLPVMKSLYSLAKKATLANARGGELLNLIYRYSATMRGNKEVDKILEELLRKSCRPYMQMLEQWVYSGVIVDPHNEFFVEENSDVHKGHVTQDRTDAYWEQKYTLRRQEESVPLFLAHIAERAFLTGKYLNVIRECGRYDVRFQPAAIRSFGERKKRLEETGQGESSYRISVLDVDLEGSINQTLLLRVEEAHAFANNELFKVIMHEKELLSHLRALKKYLLMEQGDWISHFMEVASEELSKPLSSIAVWKLNSHLEVSLDPFVEKNVYRRNRLACALLPYSLKSQILRLMQFSADVLTPFPPSDGISRENKDKNKSPLLAGEVEDPGSLTGYDTFTLEMNVEWPLSLVISRSTLTKYQLLFRHLFQCKRISRRLRDAWTWQQSTKEIHSALRTHFVPLFSLRHRMLHFVDTLERYMVVDVLAPNWAKMEKKMREATTVEEVMNLHTTFLDDCLLQCLLTDHRLVLVVLLSFSLLHHLQFVTHFTDSQKRSRRRC
ncbi:gamma tubulin complex Spc97/GCP2 subunit Alp4, variant 2 [Balamuthia mandrillaris]